jgi:hypothetical protein
MRPLLSHLLLEFREVTMPDPAKHAEENLLVEILAPTRFSCRGTVVCDCCRQWKSKDEFDEDAFGICVECLGTDAILIDVLGFGTTSKEPARSRQRSGVLAVDFD